MSMGDAGPRSGAWCGARPPAPRRLAAGLAALALLIPAGCGSGSSPRRQSPGPARGPGPAGPTAPGPGNGSPQPPGASPRAILLVTYFPHGARAGGQRAWSLHCNPTGGTHPRRRQACAELDARGVPALRASTRVCTRFLRLGTPVALVRGRLGGQTVGRLFRPGCDAAWTELHALLTGR